MKLSMWMIANRLSAMDPVVDLDEDAPVTLNSARRAYATNCVHVYGEDEDVVCKGDGGSIRFGGMDVRTGFEVMQSVFDYFQDWETGIQERIRAEDFQAAVDMAWQVLKNPIVLFDGNNRVLGITRQYPEDSLDVEWRYISRYGYSSIDAVRQMRYSRGDSRKGITVYGTRENSQVAFGNTTVPLTWGDITCGRLTLLSYEHPMNPGDYQLLELLVELLRPSLAQMFFQNEKSSTVDVFLNLLLNKPYGEEQLEARLRYTTWKNTDPFYVAVAQVTGDGRAHEYGMQQVQQILTNYIPNTVVLKNGSDLAIVGTRDLSGDGTVMDTLLSLLNNNPLHIGFSMEGKGVKSLGVLYNQARYAIRRGIELERDGRVFSFFRVAEDYMLESPLQEAVGAVMPRITEVWEESRGGDDLVNTLRIYLGNNCSAVKTAADLYIHRNTVLYRVQKVEEMLGLNFHEVYDRSYYLTAIRVLELYDRRKGEYE